MEFEYEDWRRVATVVCLAAIGAACGNDSTGPDPTTPSEIQRAHDEFTAVRAALVANTDVADDLDHVTPVLDTLGTPVPPALRGTTFEWDDEATGYVVTGRSGAPADGIRFIVYDRSASPLAEIGFVDVTDDGDAEVLSRGVHVEKDGIPRVDYLLEDRGSSGGVTASGFVTGGSRRVDFEVAQAVSTSDGVRLDLDYTFDLDDPVLTVDVDYTLETLTSSNSTFVATFVDGADRLVFDLAQGADQAIDGAVRWNGEVAFVIEADDSGGPIFLNPDGEAPEPADERAVRGLFEFAFDGVGYLLPYLVLSDPDVTDPAGNAEDAAALLKAPEHRGFGHP